MSLLVHAALAVSLLSPADPDPHALLAAADEACAAVRSAAYVAEIEMIRPGDAPLRTHMSVWVRKWPHDPTPAPPAPDAAGMIAMSAIVPAHRLNSSFRADVRVEFGPGDVLTADGDEVVVVFAETRRLVRHALAHGGERKLDETETRLAVRTPLLDTRSLLEESRAATSVIWTGRAMVNGVECDRIEITQPIDDEATMTMRWFLGAEDHLPRRFRVETREISIGLTLSDLATNLPLPSSTFTLAAASDHQVEVVEARPEPVPLGPGASAPAFTLEDPLGQRVSLSDLRGEIVVLDFWGSWCGPCRTAMPQIQRLHESYGGRGVRVIGIACRERDLQAPSKLMQQKGYTYGLLLDGDSVAQQFQVPGYPTLFVVDGAGRVLYSHVGMSDSFYDDLAAVLDRALEAD